MNRKKSPLLPLCLTLLAASLACAFSGCSASAPDQDKTRSNGSNTSSEGTITDDVSAERQRTVQALVTTAQQLIYAQKYQEALATIDQIKQLDPANEYAPGVRDVLQDKYLLQEQRHVRGMQDYYLAKILNDPENKSIPYNDVMIYPEDWPDLSNPPLTKSGNGTLALNGSSTEPTLFKNANGDMELIGPPQIAGSLPDPSEELWVIPRDSSPPPANDDSIPKTPELVTRLTPDAAPIPLPLQSTDVHASIHAYLANVSVTQHFFNPYDTKIEAIYVFPLPHNAAVSDFVMTVGDRKIRGMIRDAAEAKQIYQQAKSQGYVASLLTEQRPNVFTQSLANLEPQKAVDISITYFNTLSYSDGWYEMAFPTVVAPRYNRAQTPDPITPVPASTPPNPNLTQVPYLHENQPGSAPLTMSIQLDALVPIQEILTPYHQTQITQNSPSQATISLDPADNLANRDFVLRYRVANAQTQAAMFTQPDNAGGGYFTLMVYPPQQLKVLPRQPVELVFVVDCSGSQSGAPLDQSKAAVQYCLDHVDPDDAIQVVTFSDDTTQLFDQPLPASPQNVATAKGYVSSLHIIGGTKLTEGLRTALQSSSATNRIRYVVFFTDGFISDERDTLSKLHDMIGNSRVFSVGVGSSTNRYLLEEMAKTGNGAVTYLSTEDDATKVMAPFLETISHPALTHIDLNLVGSQISDQYPAKIPDLFVGRPVVVTGKYRGNPPTGAQITAFANHQPLSMDLPSSSIASLEGQAGLPQIWARMKIADLYDSALLTPNFELNNQIKSLALQYNLMSPFTSFIAVDASAITAGNHGETIQQPVALPAGIRYDTNVEK